MLQDLHMPILQLRYNLFARVKKRGGVKLFPFESKSLELDGANKGFNTYLIVHGD